MQGWLTLDTIPDRVKLCISLPDSESWQAQFLGAFLELSKSENWEEFGALTVDEMADEWRAIFFEFVENQEVCMPIGAIIAFSGQSAPGGFLLCHGQTVLRADYPALFAIVGTIYGASVGGTEFNIPDLRHMVPVGVDEDGPSGFDLGDIGGEIDHTLIVSETPTHTHTQNSHNHTQDSHGHPFQTRVRTATVSGASGLVEEGLNAVALGPNGAVGGFVATNQGAIATNQNSGGGESHNNMPPYLAVNYIIKY